MNTCNNHILGIGKLHINNLWKLEDAPLYLGHYIAAKKKHIVSSYEKCPNCDSTIDFAEYDKYRALVMEHNEFTDSLISKINKHTENGKVVLFTAKGNTYECISCDSRFCLHLKGYGSHTIHFSIKFMQFLGRNLSDSIPKEIKDYLNNYKKEFNNCVEFVN